MLTFEIVLGDLWQANNLGLKRLAEKKEATENSLTEVLKECLPTAVFVYLSVSFFQKGSMQVNSLYNNSLWMFGKPHLQHQILSLLVTQYFLASKYKRGFKKTRKLFCVLGQFFTCTRIFRISITLSMTMNQKWCTVTS